MPKPSLDFCSTFYVHRVGFARFFTTTATAFFRRLSPLLPLRRLLLLSPCSGPKTCVYVTFLFGCLGTVTPRGSCALPNEVSTAVTAFATSFPRKSFSPQQIGCHRHHQTNLQSARTLYCLGDLAFIIGHPFDHEKRKQRFKVMKTPGNLSYL